MIYRNEGDAHLRLAFSTLGCPNWELKQIAEAARSLGYDGIELRAVGGDLDLLGRVEFKPEALATTHRRLLDQNVSVCCVDSSCTFDSPDADERSKQVELAVRHAELAAALGAPLIRVFPDKVQGRMTRGQTRDNIADCLRKVAERVPAEVRVGLETHGDFACGAATAEIVKLAEHPNVAVIWDVANSLAAGDSIEDAANAVSPYLAHVHLRDAHAVPGSEHWLPVLAGRGQVSFARALSALQSLNFEGYISFEWEKYWHPEIEEPEVALPDFIRAMTALGLRTHLLSESGADRGAPRPA